MQNINIFLSQLGFFNSLYCLLYAKFIITYSFLGNQTKCAVFKNIVL